MKFLSSVRSLALSAMMAVGDARSSSGSGQALEIVPSTELRLKVRPQGYNTFVTTRNPDTSQLLTLTDSNVASVDLSRLSRAQGTRQLLRSFSRQAPVVSSAMAAHLRTAITRGYKVLAYTQEGTFDREMTKAAQLVVAALDHNPQFQEGATVNYGLRALSESFAMDMLTYGAMCAELVLNEAFLPSRIMPLSSSVIRFKPRSQKRGLAPVQEIEGEEINLDIPTFFYASLDQDLLDAYSRSPFESVIKPTFASESLMADLLRVARRAVHPRQVITLIEENLRANAPEEVINSADPNAMSAYIDGVILGVQQSINALSPEDALILTDSVKAEYLNNGNTSISREWDVLQEVFNAQLSSGTKTAPTILGHHNGASNIASAEIQLFIKQVQGAVQEKLNDLYSHMLTLSIRLMGHDGYVVFKYNDIELRSELERESFMSVRQSRLLEEVSLGFRSEDEYCMDMYGTLAPDSIVGKLQGTMFKSKSPSDINGYDGETNNGSTLNNDQKAETPTGVKGQNKRRNPLKED